MSPRGELIAPFLAFVAIASTAFTQTPWEAPRASVLLTDQPQISVEMLMVAEATPLP